MRTVAVWGSSRLRNPPHLRWLMSSPCSLRRRGSSRQRSFFGSSRQARVERGFCNFLWYRPDARARAWVAELAQSLRAICRDSPV